MKLLICNPKGHHDPRTGITNFISGYRAKCKVDSWRLRLDKSSVKRVSRTYQENYSKGKLIGLVDYDYSAFERQFYVAPSFALKVGADYYVWDYFHFFANLTYVNSNIRGTQTGIHKMDELLFSAGLGFQINTIKSK
jgi:hypothetical protein